MNNKKTLAILIIFFAIIMIVAIGYFLFYYNFEQDIEILKNKGEKNEVVQQEIAEAEDITQIVKTIKQEKKEAVPVSEEKIDEASLLKTAASFIERYGSYSNQSDYQNIVDLKIFMSNDMKDWADDFILKQRKEGQKSENYEGIITKAILSKFESIDDDKQEANILVKVQQTKLNQTDSTTTYSDVFIIFIKEDGGWKVKEVEWKQ